MSPPTKPVSEDVVKEKLMLCAAEENDAVLDILKVSLRKIPPVIPSGVVAGR